MRSVKVLREQTLEGDTGVFQSLLITYFIIVLKIPSDQEHLTLTQPPPPPKYGCLNLLVGASLPNGLSFTGKQLSGQTKQENARKREL